MPRKGQGKEDQKNTRRGSLAVSSKNIVVNSVSVESPKETKTKTKTKRKSIFKKG